MTFSKIKLLFFFCAVLAERNLFAAPAPLSLNLGRFGFQIKTASSCLQESSYTRGRCSAGEKCFATIKAACGAMRLRFQIMSGISAAQAEKTAKTRFTVIKQLYSGRMEYPGAITSAAEVPKNLRPRFAESHGAAFGTAYLPATAAFTYGAGAPDLVKYSAAMTHLYCPVSRSLVQIEVFALPAVPDADLDTVLKGAGCRAAVPGKMEDR